MGKILEQANQRKIHRSGYLWGVGREAIGEVGQKGTYMENSHLLYLAGEYTLPILMLFFKESSVFYTLFCSYDLFCNELFLFSRVANRLQHLNLCLQRQWACGLSPKRQRMGSQSTGLLASHQSPFFPVTLEFSSVTSTLQILSLATPNFWVLISMTVNFGNNDRIPTQTSLVKKLNLLGNNSTLGKVWEGMLSRKRGMKGRLLHILSRHLFSASLSVVIRFIFLTQLNSFQTGTIASEVPRLMSSIFTKRRNFPLLLSVHSNKGLRQTSPEHPPLTHTSTL